MISAKDRLAFGAATLAVIDQRREQTQDVGLGAGSERFIINRELRELEEDVLLDPGARKLVPRRQTAIQEPKQSSQPTRV